MAQSPDDSSGDGEKTEPERRTIANAVDKNLPMVVGAEARRRRRRCLRGGARACRRDRRGRTAGRLARFLLLAATVAFAASFGSFVGSVSGSGFVHYSVAGRSGAGDRKRQRERHARAP